MRRWWAGVGKKLGKQHDSNGSSLAVFLVAWEPAHLRKRQDSTPSLLYWGDAVLLLAASCASVP